MVDYNLNGINFKLNADTVAPFPGKYTDERNYDSNTGLYDIRTNKLNNIGILQSFNAVEIDWNNAVLNPSNEPEEKLSYTTITSTGQLLKNIENLQAQVNVLTTLVKGLYNAIQTQS